jgi:hypothetical protein
MVVALPVLEGNSGTHSPTWTVGPPAKNETLFQWRLNRHGVYAITILLVLKYARSGQCRDNFATF